MKLLSGLLTLLLLIVLSACSSDNPVGVDLEPIEAKPELASLTIRYGFTGGFRGAGPPQWCRKDPPSFNRFEWELSCIQPDQPIEIGKSVYLNSPTPGAKKCIVERRFIVFFPTGQEERKVGFRVIETACGTEGSSYAYIGPVQWDCFPLDCPTQAREPLGNQPHECFQGENAETQFLPLVSGKYYEIIIPGNKVVLLEGAGLATCDTQAVIQFRF